MKRERGSTLIIAATHDLSTKQEIDGERAEGLLHNRWDGWLRKTIDRDAWRGVAEIGVEWRPMGSSGGSDGSDGGDGGDGGAGSDGDDGDVGCGGGTRCERSRFDQAAKLNLPYRVAQGDHLIPVIGSEVCVVGGGKWVRHIKEWSMTQAVSG